MAEKRLPELAELEALLAAQEREVELVRRVLKKVGAAAEKARLDGEAKIKAQTREAALKLRRTRLDTGRLTVDEANRFG